MPGVPGNVVMWKHLLIGISSVVRSGFGRRFIGEFKGASGCNCFLQFELLQMPSIPVKRWFSGFFRKQVERVDEYRAGW